MDKNCDSMVIKVKIINYNVSVLFFFFLFLSFQFSYEASPTQFKFLRLLSREGVQDISHECLKSNNQLVLSSFNGQQIPTDHSRCKVRKRRTSTRIRTCWVLYILRQFSASRNGEMISIHIGLKPEHMVAMF